MAGTDALPGRILVVGKSGSGKSTLAKKLSVLNQVEHIELDTLFWNPGLLQLGLLAIW